MLSPCRCIVHLCVLKSCLKEVMQEKYFSIQWKSKFHIATFSVGVRVISSSSVPFQFDSTPIFNIDLILLGESQIQISKENVFIFYVGARVCPPLWLTNSDIRLLFAQLEWCGTKVTYKAAVVGAINHIGPGINHSIEDIFCHCCPLPITLHKKQPPSHTHTSFFSSIFPSATKETTDWSQEDGRMSLFPAILHAG